MAAACLALMLAACVTVGRPTGYSREAPAGVYPAGELSGPPAYFVGWKQPFIVDGAGVLRWSRPAGVRP